VDLIKEVLILSALLSPIHVGLVEAIKLTGVRVRRYYEALASIVYARVPEDSTADATSGAKPAVQGEDPSTAKLAPAAQEAVADSRRDPPLAFLEEWFRHTRLTPEWIGPGARREWAQGAQRNVVEAFALRALGDSPTAEISDQDVRNVIRVVRAAAPASVRLVVETFDALIQSGVNDPATVVAALRNAHREIAAASPTDHRVRARLESLLSVLGDPSTAGSVAPLLAQWWRKFIEDELPGEMLARVDLMNCLRAAEYRYHQDVRVWSAWIALAEALAVGIAVRKGILALQVAEPAAYLTALFAGVVTVGLLLVLPQTSKSLLDMIKGLGDRLRV
jgi:hypothetical protein